MSQSTMIPRNNEMMMDCGVVSHDQKFIVVSERRVDMTGIATMGVLPLPNRFRLSRLSVWGFFATTLTFFSFSYSQKPWWNDSNINAWRKSFRLQMLFDGPLVCRRFLFSTVFSRLGRLAFS
jgi:hypothetical protein